MTAMIVSVTASPSFVYPPVSVCTTPSFRIFRKTVLPLHFGRAGA